jgi:hypothetical protein
VSVSRAIPRTGCQKINLSSRDPRSINPQDFANRENEGVLLVPKAVEMLYHLKQQPKSAGGE